jgi:cysteine desulfurase
VILNAVGLPERQTARTLRIGIGRFTSAADIDYAAAALSAAHAACEAATSDTCTRPDFHVPNDCLQCLK